MAHDEEERLAGLRRYRILDTVPEQQFDDAVLLVRRLCDVPIALVSLVDADRQYFKAASGIDATETPRDTSVCSLAIEQRGLFVVPDLTLDPRTAGMSLVRNAPHLRFYAGAPLVTSDGIALGSLCAIDLEPRPAGLTDDQRSSLAALGRHVTTLIENRLAAAREAEAQAAAREAEAHYRHVIDSAIDSAIIGIDLLGGVTAWSKGAETLFGWSQEEMIGRPLATIFTPEDRARGCPDNELRTAREIGRAPDERWHMRKDGSRFYAHGAVTPLLGDGERGFVKSLRDITEDHANRVALERNREELELATRAARMGRFDYKPGSGVLSWDDRCRELFGLRPGAPVDYESAFLAGLHPDDRDQADAEVAAALDPAGPRTFGLEYRTIGIEDGIERHVAAHGLAIFDGDRPIRLIGTVQDITASRRTIERLAQTEERLRLAAQATNDAIWDWDLVSDEVQWNEALYGAYGFRRDQVDAKSAWWITQIHPDDRERVSDSIHAVIAGTGSDWLETYRFLRADGSYADIKDRGYVIRDDHGRATRMIGAMLDDTDQMNLRRALESRVTARTEELDRLWATSPDLLLVMDFDGYFRRVNPAWTAILGYTPDELIGHHVGEFLLPDYADDANAAIATARTTTVEAVVNQYRHKDGSARWFSWVAAPASGALYATGRHITAAKEAEAALRTAEDQLRQAQKVEAIGQLTGGVAHDFNNLLTVIRGSVDLLRRPSLSEDKRARYIAAIADTADRAMRLTSQLLAFARRQALTPQVFDVGASVLALREMVGTLTGPRLETRYDVPVEPAFVKADRNQFDTALVNMAVNARDAMGGEGRLSITVRCVDRVPPIRHHAEILGAHVAIEIADTGSGISPDRIEHIFEPFFTTKEAGHGTGLGLSQVFGFAKQSGGDILVVSEPGVGTTFTLYLKIAAAPGETGEDGDRAGRTRLAEGSCILVVEDNAEVGRFATEALSELGYRSHWAQSAEAALAILDRSPATFDVVFTDVVMPGRSGVELAEEVKRLYPVLPVILTSGYSNVLAEQGARGFPLLQKPYSIEELARILHTLVVEA